MKRFAALILLLASPAFASDSLSVFDRTFEIVKASFYDKTFRGLPWDQLVQTERKKIKQDTSTEELSAVANSLLDRLHASHTEFLSSEDQEYYALLAILNGQIDGFPYCGIGAIFQKIDGLWFVRSLYRDSPAQRAGLLTGDEIVLADGKPFRPVRSFDCASRNPVRLEVRRNKDGATKTYTIRPETSAPEAALLRETTTSKTILREGKNRIGYFHLWAGTDDAFKDALDQAAAEFQKKADAMILDLRDGFGGAYPAYLDSFFSKVYTKPLYVLINDGVRSGKEWITFLLKQKKRATLIGARTKGYFLAGKIFEIVPKEYALFLAVTEFKPDGIDLEGNGVLPDVSVPFDFRYSAGADPQLAQAISISSAEPRDSHSRIRHPGKSR